METGQETWMAFHWRAYTDNKNMTGSAVSITGEKQMIIGLLPWQSDNNKNMEKVDLLLLMGM